MKAKVLVTDDERIIRERLGKLLSLDSYNVFLASDGEECLKIFRAEKPKIVLVDVKMPGMSGIEVLEIIKDESPKTEVIVITGHGGTETAIQALRKEAFDYITKPIEFEELELVILKALAKQKMQKKLDTHIKDLEIANKRLKESQAYLIQSGKMAALGQLAAGVAHEINNPLTTITMNTSFLIEEFQKEEKKTVKLQAIEREADRAATIVKSLLTFARKSRAEGKEMAPVSHVIEETLKPITNQFTLSNIEIVLEFADDLPMVSMNVNQIQQVFLNLVNNARDAMPEGGKIVIRTGLRKIAKKGRRRTDAIKKDQKAVSIDFIDTGEGISAENLASLFVPFFTTKEPGKGTGLGLYITQGIVADHGGELLVESRAGKGTTFTVCLPLE